MKIKEIQISVGETKPEPQAGVVVWADESTKVAEECHGSLDVALGAAGVDEIIGAELDALVDELVGMGFRSFLLYGYLDEQPVVWQTLGVRDERTDSGPNRGYLGGTPEEALRNTIHGEKQRARRGLLGTVRGELDTALRYLRRLDESDPFRRYEEEISAAAAYFAETSDWQNPEWGNE